MAAQKHKSNDDRKRRSKKRKSRTEVSSSSESEEQVERKKTRNVEPNVEEVEVEVESKSSRKSTPISHVTITTHSRKTWTDSPEGITNSTAPKVIPPTPKSQRVESKTAAPTTEDQFSTLYLRKITTELADDLDKVRETPDFKASSVAMLVHALRQGERLFSTEEKKAFIGTA